MTPPAAPAAPARTGFVRALPVIAVIGGIAGLLPLVPLVMIDGFEIFLGHTPVFLLFIILAVHAARTAREHGSPAVLVGVVLGGLLASLGLMLGVLALAIASGDFLAYALYLQTPAFLLLTGAGGSCLGAGTAWLAVALRRKGGGSG